MAAGPPPLAAVRVLERTDGLAGSYAGFLLAAFGADVVRVAEARGAATPGERVLHRGKRLVDLATAATLVGRADVVLVDEAAPPLEPSRGAIHCVLTAWDGASDLPPDDTLLGAATGVQAMQWSWAGRPVWIVTPMVSYMAGLLAALGTTSAVLARRRGRSVERVEVSGLAAAMALNSGTYVTGPETRGSLSQFGDPRGQIATYSLFPTADGWLFVGALTQAFLVKLLTVLDRVDLLADPRLQSNPLAFGVPEVKALVRRELDPIFAARGTAEWARRLREADIPCGPVETRDAALRDPEARTLGAVVAVEDPVLGPSWQPGPPAVFSATPLPEPRPPRPAGTDVGWTDPSPGGTSRAPDSGGCLAGIRVLDLASFIAGPFCPMLLADLGADVVKVESPDGDPFRMTLFGFVGWNRGKRSLVLDLKRAGGREVFLDLARSADVVVDNFRAGVMERLGIGWETLAALNSRQIHTSITGYGSTGPLASLPGFDPIFQARSGLMLAQGGDEPVFHMVAYTDYMAGALGALATVAALVARERGGDGQRVDASLLRTSYVSQAADMVLAASMTPSTSGGRDFLGPGACRRLYRCADGWVCVAATTPVHAAALARVAGVPVSLDDGADAPSAVAIAGVLAGESRADGLRRLRAAGVPATPCLGFQELFSDPILRGNGYLVEQVHPTLGTLLVPAPFIRFDGVPSRPGRSSPLLGADAADVLAGIGYGPERVAALVGDGVVGRSP